MIVVVDESPPGEAVIQIEVPGVGAADHAQLYEGVETRDASDKILTVSRPLFREAIAMVRSCAEEVMAQFNDMDKDSRPDEAEVQLAVKMDGKLGAKIVELSSGAQLQVTLRWKQENR